MPDTTLDCLARQFGTAWSLAQYHLDGLSTEECLWRPAAVGPHVHRSADGCWHADWPAHEGYGIGPPSIAWLTWHVGYWWSTVLDRSFGAGTLAREDVTWPGDAAATCHWLGDLARRWQAVLGSLDDDDLRSSQRTHWPFASQPFVNVIAWLNLELMKNAAEIGYARFLYAARGHRPGR